MTNCMSLSMLARRFVALGLFAFFSSALVVVPSCSSAVCEANGDGCPCTTPHECFPNSCYAAACDGTCHLEAFPPGGRCLLVEPCAEPGKCVMGFCTAKHQCVECLDDAHCPAGHTCEVGDVCSRCDDGVKNGDEAEADCGGSCPLCPGTCNVDADCPDGYCWEGLCISCHDGIQNGDEADVDCGPWEGHCKVCVGMNCWAGDDNACVRSECENGYCCSAPCPLCYNCGPSGECEPVLFWHSDVSNPDPNLVCEGTSACNGKGKCTLESGQPCTQDDECLWNVCSNGKCN